MLLLMYRHANVASELNTNNGCFVQCFIKVDMTGLVLKPQLIGACVAT